MKTDFSINVHFNSIKVRLEHDKYNGDFCFTYFNSIKVRLEPSSMKPIFVSLNEFQFHKGAIRTITERRTTIKQLISIP